MQTPMKTPCRICPGGDCLVAKARAAAKLDVAAELDAAIDAYIATASRFDARTAEGFDHAAHERDMRAAEARLRAAQAAAKGGAA